MFILMYKNCSLFRLRVKGQNTSLVPSNKQQLTVKVRRDRLQPAHIKEIRDNRLSRDRHRKNDEFRLARILSYQLAQTDLP